MWWLLAGCDDTVFVEPCPPAFALGPEGCVFDEDAVAEIARTFDAGGLVRINAAPFRQYAGSSIRRNVWVTPVPLGNGQDAVDLYLGVDPTSVAPVGDPLAFPVGTVVVHEAVDREEGHGVTVRREEGWTDEEGRGWYMAKLFDDGTPDAVPCTPCVACHSDAARPATDGLWGVPPSAL